MEPERKMISLREIVAILFILAIRFVSGLEMCNKAMTPPKIEGLRFSPEVPDDQKINEIRVSLQIKARIHFRIEWLSFRNMFTRASPANENFKSSRASSKDMMTFNLYSRSNRSETFVEQISDIQLLIFLGRNNDCNYVSWSLTLKSLRNMVQGNIALPTIFALPKRKYVVDKDGNNPLTLTVSRDQWTDSFRDRMTCRYVAIRMNGQIELTSREPKQNTLSASDATKSTNEVDRASYTCIVDMTAIESLQTIIAYTFQTKQLNDALHFSVEIGMGVELRRKGINTPAVTAIANQFMEHRHGVIYLATDRPDTVLYCIAEGPVPPGIAAAKIEHLSRGDFDLLEPIRDHLNKWDKPKPVFFTFKNFMIRSPDVGQAEEYVCSAAVDGEVVNQRVNLLRYVGVMLKEHDLVYAGEGYDLYPRTRLNDTITASCETTKGAPPPTIKFYGSPPSLNAWRKKDFLKANEGYEIVDSMYFRVEVRNTNGQAKGKITVHDMNNATVAELKGWDYRDGTYSIYCVAFNEYSIDIAPAIKWSIRN